MAQIRSSANPVRRRTNAANAQATDDVENVRGVRVHCVDGGRLLRGLEVRPRERGAQRHRRSRGSRREPLPPTPARELVSKYCVTCHNERLKTAGLLARQG